ncbi:MAG TPA: hypothetical protein VGN86_06650 [Pyrinomonadaceae bacterium]|jgi:hypothetical protein|nr:hypothetical protein [Pyrinomonadaceae bacterium]
MNTQTKERQKMFWKRQFASTPTPKQTVFDVTFGILAPVLCFVLDPIAFQGSNSVLGAPLFEKYQTFAYLFSGIQIIVLIIWLWWGVERARGINSFLGGIMFAGGLFCSLLGLMLAPFSLMGLVVVIGVLGFTPFVTGFVYFRNAYRALEREAARAVPGRAVSSLLLGCVLSFTLSHAVSKGVERKVDYSVDQILYGNDPQALAAARNVRSYSFLMSYRLNRIVDEYRKESTEQYRKERLAKFYEEATGENLDQKIRIMMD